MYTYWYVGAYARTDTYFRGSRTRLQPFVRYNSHCNTLQHTATHCNTLHHTATEVATTRGWSVLIAIARMRYECKYVVVCVYIYKYIDSRTCVLMYVHMILWNVMVNETAITRSCSTSLLAMATVCCSVLQCVAVCCSVLQCVAVCCSVLQWEL